MRVQEPCQQQNPVPLRIYWWSTSRTGSGRHSEGAACCEVFGREELHQFILGHKLSVTVRIRSICMMKKPQLSCTFLIAAYIILTPGNDVQIKLCPGKSLLVVDMLNREDLDEHHTDGTMIHYLHI